MNRRAFLKLAGIGAAAGAVAKVVGKGPDGFIVPEKRITADEVSRTFGFTPGARMDGRLTDEGGMVDIRWSFWNGEDWQPMDGPLPVYKPLHSVRVVGTRYGPGIVVEKLPLS